jgi:hypothetical protein
MTLKTLLEGWLLLAHFGGFFCTPKKLHLRRVSARIFKIRK